MRRILFMLCLFILPAAVFSQTGRRQQSFNLSGKSVAIQGYDPVAYFQQGKAVPGKSAHATVYEGVTYYFSSAQNKTAFGAKPASYEPQYGGWCAYAMGATGEKVEVDPETFKIVDGKLYLFYNKFFNNTLKLWNKDEKNLHAKADAHWNQLFNQ